MIYDNEKNLINPFRSALIADRAELYSHKIRDVGAMLPNCIGFTDVTKIHMFHPSGNNILQQSVHSGHKQIHCSFFCTITSPYSLIFFCDGLVEFRVHDLFIFHFLGLSEELQKGLMVGGVQFYIYLWVPGLYQSH